MRDRINPTTVRCYAHWVELAQDNLERLGYDDTLTDSARDLARAEYRLAHRVLESVDPALRAAAERLYVTTMAK